MSDAILPMLLLPAVIGWWFSEWKQRAARPTLRSAVEAMRVPVLADAGCVSVVSLARSLQLASPPESRRCPWWLVGRRRSAWDVQELVAPLGLELTDLIGVYRDRLGRPAGFVGASRFSGVRHGRLIDVELGTTASAITVATRGGAPACELSGDGRGRLVAHGGAPLSLTAALETLQESRHWRGVNVVVGGSEVAVIRHDHCASSWLHDLWLAEFVADLVGPAIPSDTVVAADAGSAALANA